MPGHNGEGTVDGCHPNDLGMTRTGEVFGQAIKRPAPAIQRIPAFPSPAPMWFNTSLH